jgi:hypothetical protein
VVDWSIVVRDSTFWCSEFRAHDFGLARKCKVKAAANIEFNKRIDICILIEEAELFGYGIRQKITIA